jgi:hypothetical protein
VSAFEIKTDPSSSPIGQVAGHFDFDVDLDNEIDEMESIMMEYKMPRLGLKIDHEMR